MALNIENQTLWPYKKEGENSSKCKLNRLEKLYLGEQMALGILSIRSLSVLYQLNKRTLSDYKCMFISQGRIYDGKGRPRCFDDTTQSMIIEKLKAEPDMPESTLRFLIRKYHKQLWTSNTDPHLMRYSKISIRSVVRYSKLIRNVALASSSNADDLSNQPSLPLPNQENLTAPSLCCIN